MSTQLKKSLVSHEIIAEKCCLFLPSSPRGKPSTNIKVMCNYGLKPRYCEWRNRTFPSYPLPEFSIYPSTTNIILCFCLHKIYINQFLRPVKYKKEDTRCYRRFCVRRIAPRSFIFPVVSYWIQTHVRAGVAMYVREGTQSSKTKS